MYCKNCGSEIQNGVAFCTVCGSQVEPQVNNAQNVNYNPYSGQIYYSNTDQMLSAFPEKISRAKSFTLAGLIMSVISFVITILEIITGLIFPAVVFGYQVSFNSFVRELASGFGLDVPVQIMWVILIACAVIFIIALVFSAYSVAVLSQKYKQITAINDRLKYQYDRDALESFLMSFKTNSLKTVRILNIISCLALLSIPMCIAQILAATELINLKKDYESIVQMYGNAAVRQ